MPLFHDEIAQKLPNKYWETLTSYCSNKDLSNGDIAGHTINVLYRMLQNEQYAKLSPYF